MSGADRVDSPQSASNVSLLGFPTESDDMTTSALEKQDAAIAAVVAAVARIDASEFAAYPGGWPKDIGLALVDAVFSIRARYHSTTPGRGVYNRLRELQSRHAEVTDDLQALVEVGADGIAAVMGHTKTRGRRKADCVIDAATALLGLDPPVRRAEDASRRNAEAITCAYTRVPGLGSVTAEYFRMLLGQPGVKADVMVRRFVNAALATRHLPPETNAHAVHELIVAAHERDPRGVGLTAYEHAVWRTKGVLPQAA